MSWIMSNLDIFTSKGGGEDGCNTQPTLPLPQFTLETRIVNRSLKRDDSTLRKLHSGNMLS